MNIQNVPSATKRIPKNRPNSNFTAATCLDAEPVFHTIPTPTVCNSVPQICQVELIEFLESFPRSPKVGVGKCSGIFSCEITFFLPHIESYSLDAPKIRISC